MRRKPIIVSAMFLMFAILPVLGKVYQTQDEALKAAFGEAEVRRKTHFLTPAQRSSAEELCGTKLKSEIVYSYSAYEADVPTGTAYFDIHRVRTLPETVMIIVNPDFTVRDIQVLAFHEPEEYLPPRRWYAQFGNRALDAELTLKRGIQGVTGATLTARASVNAARRILAIHRVLQKGQPP